MADPARERFDRLVSLTQSGNWGEAAARLRKALLTAPKDPNLLQLAAYVAEKLKEPERAILYYRRALAALPHLFEAGMNLARVLSSVGKDGEALEILGGLASHHPNRPEIPEAQARLSQKTGALPAAASFWGKALALAPHNPEGRGQRLFCLRQIADWSEEPPASDPDLSPNIAVLLFDDPALQRAAAERFCARRFAGGEPLPSAPPYAHERLRVGYLSSDFHEHATAWLIAELFELHDRAAFEVYAYSYGIEDHSAIRERLRAGADHFVTLNALTPRQCAERIRADEIDVLVDLKGHTTGARLDILACRPAQRQLHWLGFPATTGAAFIDAFIADPVTVPDGAEAFFTERVMRLPLTYQINDRQKTIGETQSRAAYGLPETGLVLASFNQTYKITPEVFDVWCSILKEKKDAVLWLLESNSYAPDALRREAAARGVEPSRLFFASSTPQAEHLARYRIVDLALDTHPVGGHTTTSDALWAGAPVVTWAGQSFVSRVAASLLTAAGLPQLVSHDREGYRALISRLIEDAQERNALRAHLERNRASLPLFDTPRFVKELENALKNAR